MRGLVSIHQNFKLCWVPLVSFISYYLFVYYLIFIESFYIRWDNFKVSYRWNKRLSSSTRRTSCEKNNLANSRVEALSTFLYCETSPTAAYCFSPEKGTTKKTNIFINYFSFHERMFDNFTSFSSQTFLFLPRLVSVSFSSLPLIFHYVEHD